MTEEQRERWNKNRRERYANSPEVRERHRLSQEKWVAKKLEANPNYLSDYMKNWRKKKQSLFQQITQSPEVLAPHFVYHIDYGDAGGGYVSTVVKGLWHTEVEAIAATVEKLKEVCKVNEKLKTMEDSAKCECCGKMYYKKKKVQRFCSIKCKDKWWNRERSADGEYLHPHCEDNFNGDW